MANYYYMIGVSFNSILSAILFYFYNKKEKERIKNIYMHKGLCFILKKRKKNPIELCQRIILIRLDF